MLCGWYFGSLIGSWEVVIWQLGSGDPAISHNEVLVGDHPANGCSNVSSWGMDPLITRPYQVPIQIIQLAKVNSASTRSDPYEVGSQCLGLWTPAAHWSCAHWMIFGDKGHALGIARALCARLAVVSWTEGQFLHVKLSRTGSAKKNDVISWHFLRLPKHDLIPSG